MDRFKTKPIECETGGKNLASASDEELVEAALGDVRFFELLYERYADRLYRYSLSRTGSPTVADDIVSASVVRAFERLEQFDPQKGQFKTWIFTIARRQIADNRRHHRRFWRAVNRRWRPDPAADSAFEVALRREEHHRVHEAINMLPDISGEALRLRYVADLPIAAVADVLGISQGATKMRISRALKQLADELEHDFNVD